MKRAALGALFLLAGCVTDAATRRLTLEDELLDADRAFARDVQQRRIDGWVAGFDEHGSQVDPTGKPVTGRDAIRAYMQGAFADPKFQLSWEPVEARVPEEGRLGFVWGHWTLRGPDGPPQQGRYLDIWHRGAHGKWLLLFDVGEGAKPGG